MLVEQPFPWARVRPYTAPPQYARLRAHAPVAQARLANGQRIWLILGHNHVRRILTDPRISSEHSHPGFPSVFPTSRHRSADGEPTRLTYSGMDRPQHAVHRRMINGEFAARRIATLRPAIQQIVDDRVTALLAGPRGVDLAASLAEPIPAAVITELLAVPPDMRPALRDLSRTVLSHADGPARIQAASAELRRLIAELVTGKESSAQNDLLTRLIRRYRAASSYDRRQLIELTGALVTAGHESTASMISLSVLTLLTHPDQWARLAADPTLVPRATEELLRYVSVADLVTARVALADIEIAGTVIPAGAGIIALGAAANHDPSVFEHPELFDIRRDPTRHIAFGHGIHKCLGEHLARLELEVVLATLIARVPGLRLAVGEGELRLRNGSVLQSIEALPVTW